MNVLSLNYRGFAGRFLMNEAPSVQRQKMESCRVMTHLYAGSPVVVHYAKAKILHFQDIKHGRNKEAVMLVVKNSDPCNINSLKCSCWLLYINIPTSYQRD